ncbi:MAG: GlyGly-CTERM sorting domain-containing protein [Alteromonadaceae bacterium]|nr:GlyGly-CTERM sorting domain-containing protein [Alteromonadaceae bacterium]
MNKLRPTLLATVISAALSSTAAFAAHDVNHTSLSNFDKASATASIPNFSAKLQQNLASQPTASGMPSQFDAKLGKATFVWAPAQNKVPDMNLILPEQKAAFASAHYLKSLTGMTTSENASNKAVMAYMHDTKRGPLVAKYRQEVEGIEVFNKEYNVMMDREYNLVAGSGYFSAPVSTAESLALLTSFGTPEDAITSAIADLSNGGTEVSLERLADKGKYNMFEATTLEGLHVVGTPRAKKVLYEYKGKLVSAHYVEVSLAHFESLTSNDYSYVVANDGEILFRKNLVSHSNDFTYRVFSYADGYPMEGPHGDVIPKLDPTTADQTTLVDMSLVTLPYYSKISTQDPWLAEDATITSGNNVFAYADVMPPQDFSEGDITVSVTSPKTFDYPLDLDQSANSFGNRQSAVVNMFYVNNFLHDWWYDHGFDEASGNAQLSNYGRGGEEGDPLEVQAQDYSGLNNANMATPADGASPRMQQFLFNSKDAVNGVDQGLEITSHPDLGLLQSTQLASFGPAQYRDVVGEVVRLVDGNDVDSGSVTDGCEAATNPEELAGKIAIVDRGSCNFTLKVLNAQNAGAIATIVVNNNDDGSPAPMGGADPAVLIPSQGLNFAEGNAIYDLIDADETVTADMFSNFPLKDSSYDNGIIAHEWGHYIQNRLVGNASGLINFQGRNMGEGWSDFHSLMFIAKEGDVELDGNGEWQTPYAAATYVADFYYGIRRAPYTPNMDINPLTFQHITNDAVPPGLPPTNGASPHAAGEVWATMLWDVYVGMLNTYEFAEAQSRMANYLVAGYKMTPVAPTFTEARDALLSAMYASEPADYEMALAAFARRGMGLGAISPDRFSTDNTGVVESYSTELATYSASNLTMNASYDGTELGFCSNDDVLDAGETGTVSFSVTNGGSEVLSGVTAQIEVLSDHDVTIENDGLVDFGELGLFESKDSGAIKITLNSAGIADTLMLGVTFPEAATDDAIIEPEDLVTASVVNVDFQKLDLVGTSAIDDMESLALFANFKENDLKGGASGTQVTDVQFTAFLQQFNPGVNLGAQTMLLLNNGFESDVAFETDMVEVGYGSEFAISFWHMYLLEAGWDGGVVEISVNGGNWLDVTAAGGIFDVGYNGFVQTQPSQPLSDRPVFTGRNADFASFAGNMERINFGQSLNGQTVQFRFRVATDTNTADFGWFIDNVEFTNINSSIYHEVVAGDTFACDNSAPKLTMSSSTVTIDEGATGSLTVNVQDRNAGDSHTYAWVQTGGTAATLSGADTATLSVTPAGVTADETLTFEVTVNDGTDSVTSSATVTVNDIPPAPTTPTTVNNGGGGGSTAWYSLLLLPLAWLRRRTK